jgi:hypothetical protein
LTKTNNKINTMSNFTTNKLSSTCYARVIDWFQQLAAGESENGISEYLQPDNDIDTLCADALDDRRNQQSKIDLYRDLRANAPAGAQFAELNRVWDGMDIELKTLESMSKTINTLAVEKRLVDKGFGTVTAWMKSTVEEELRTVVIEEEAQRSVDGISRALMHKRIKNRLKEELGGNPQATRISIREGLYNLQEMSNYQQLRENVMEIHRIYLLLEAHVKMYGGTAAAVDADYTQALTRSFAKHAKALMGPMVTLQQAEGDETWLQVRQAMNKLINKELSSIPKKTHHQASKAQSEETKLAFAATGAQGQVQQEDNRRKRERSSSRSRSKSRGREEAGSTPRGILRGGTRN